MEENRRFSWSSLFIKVIIVIIFVLFTIWLLSLSNNGLSNSLDVLTNNIFSENMEKMKEVGKEYFTTERLPKKIGEVETLTLEDMYEEKLILELTDKNGNACSAKDSYVSVEKYEDEYQMKVYLECGEEKDYIIVIMGCYDYCDTDICEKEEKEETTKVEYQYKKVTGGSWTDYGKWSEWSKVSVTNTDYRQVETKTEKENYSYDKTITEVVYVEREASCPEGYKKTVDGTKCYKDVTSPDTKEPVCPVLSGWTSVRDGFTCNYSKVVFETMAEDANCPTGYSNVNGTCSKPITSTITKTAECPDGYIKSGNTCVDSTPATKNPVCPTVSGYTKTSQNGFTCNYRKYVKGDYVTTETGETVPANTTSYIYEEVGSAEYIYDCENSCAFRWIHTWKVYKAKVETITKTASCPTGYTKSGNTCVETNPDTKAPTCPTVSGYTKTSQNGFTCNYSKTTYDIEEPECPVKAGWKTERNGFTCNYSRYVTSVDTDDAVCPTGYEQVGNMCSKTVTIPKYSDLIVSCPADYKFTEDGTKCFKEVKSIVKVTGTRDVTYYRYRVREYIGGTTDYKWSTSKEDKELLNAGYKLTGKTR